MNCKHVASLVWRTCSNKHVYIFASPNRSWKLFCAVAGKNFCRKLKVFYWLSKYHKLDYTRTVNMCFCIFKLKISVPAKRIRILKPISLGWPELWTTQAWACFPNKGIELPHSDWQAVSKASSCGCRGNLCIFDYWQSHTVDILTMAPTKIWLFFLLSTLCVTQFVLILFGNIGHI